MNKYTKYFSVVLLRSTPTRRSAKSVFTSCFRRDPERTAIVHTRSFVTKDYWIILYYYPDLPAQPACV